MKKSLITFLIISLVLITPFRVQATNTYSANISRSSAQWQSISDASQTGLDISGDFTIEAWVNYTTFETGQLHGLVGKYDSGGTRQYELYSYNNGGTKQIRCNVSDDGSSWDTAGTWEPTINIDTWYHLVCTYDASTGYTHLYYGTDSGDDVSQGNSATNGSKSIANTAAAFEIGRMSGIASFNFDGQIDEVRVWSDIRTLTEINDNKYSELTGSEADLISYYREEQNGNDSDATSGNDLTDNNSVTYTTDVPFGGAAPAAILRRKGDEILFNLY